MNQYVDADFYHAPNAPAYLEGLFEIEATAQAQNIWASGTCSMGAFSYAGARTRINDTSIGRYTSIGEDVTINPAMRNLDYLTTHPVSCDPSGIASGHADDPIFQTFRFTHFRNQTHEHPRVTIGNDVAIGAKAIIGGSVTIGDGAFIAAASFVNRDVPPFGVVAGSPARMVRHRLSEAVRKRIKALPWWSLDLSKLTERDFSDPEGFMDLLEAAVSAGRIGHWSPPKRLFAS